MVQQRYRERYEFPPNSILTRELPGTLAALERAFSERNEMGEADTMRGVPPDDQQVWKK